MSRLIVCGAGGHGLVVADAAEASARFGSVMFLDDAFPELSSIDDFDVVGKIADVRRVADQGDYLTVAIGNNIHRKAALSVVDVGIQIATIVHPTAAVSQRAILGNGTVVLANATVNARASLGVGCIVNSGASVDHHCEIGEFVHIAPGARLAANVAVGANSWIGAGAVIREQTQIGSNVLVAAGSVVIEDLEDGSVVAGVPAKSISGGTRTVRMGFASE